MLAVGRVASVIGAMGLAAAMALPADAATFRSATIGAAPMLLIAGSFDYADGDTFARLSATLPKSTTVVFDSPGGNLIAGLKIGETIRARGYSTLVANGSLCASACAIAWLGGTKRYLASGGRLGFHAASGAEGVSAPGNALVGAYMARLGLKEAAVYALTAASPYDIAWLNLSSARTLGVAVEPYSGPAFGSSALAANRAGLRTVGHGGTWGSNDAADDGDDGDDAPRYALPTNAAGRGSRACPAYTHGGHGGC